MARVDEIHAVTPPAPVAVKLEEKLVELKPQERS